VLVNKSGETMANIVTAIKRVNDIMSEIAAASSEQATGIQEVSNAVVHTSVNLPALTMLASATHPPVSLPSVLPVNHRRCCALPSKRPS